MVATQSEPNILSYNKNVKVCNSGPNVSCLTACSKAKSQRLSYIKLEELFRFDKIYFQGQKKLFV